MFLETKMRVMTWLIGVEPFAREYALTARVQLFYCHIHHHSLNISQKWAANRSLLNRGWDLKGLGHTHNPGDARLVTRQKWRFFEIFVTGWINDQEAFWEDVSWDKNASHDLTGWGRTICTRVCTLSSSTAILNHIHPPLPNISQKWGANRSLLK